MIHFSTSIIVQLMLGLTLWWMGVYLITQNPLNRVIQLTAGIILSISIYLSANIFFYAAEFTHQYHYYGIMLKSMSWSIYLPIALFYHVSLYLNPNQKIKSWQKLVLVLSYLGTLGLIYIDSATTLTRDYPLFDSPNFSGVLADASGKNFWILGAFIVPMLSFIMVNFYIAAKSQKKFSDNWYKFFIPFLGITFMNLLSPFILLGYYGLIPFSENIPIVGFLIVALTLAYSIIRYGLFVEDTKVLFGRNFFYSGITILLTLIIYLGLIFLSHLPLNNPNDLIFPFILILLILTSHPAFSWLTTFANDLTYNISSGLSIVNDEEVYSAIRYYNKPEQLEESPLKRLNIISRDIKKGLVENEVDSIRSLINHAIEYFKPIENISERNKQNLKYHLLRMLMKEAEEGQILWELGFEEYPVRIMSKERNLRPPMFKIESPSDYSYTSRNAYLALKKEAIHDVTWRISYLEKLSKKKLI